jgi:hypothetical protein
MMNPITLRAHFDGEKIVLDDPVKLEADTQLIVTVLPTLERNGEPVENDEVYAAWMRLSINGLAYAYGEDENEYSLDMIKEPNPDYEGG